MRFQNESFVFKFFLRSVDGKHLMRFQNESFVFKFFLRSVDGKQLMRFQSETFVSCLKHTEIHPPIKLVGYDFKSAAVVPNS